ncbi:hypothetical protein JAAARDRAFT_203257 [Jaapia argillacea MUCL 33604]|uniref:Peptidase S9 prolyl oligopeptidase catalytic domain-containing protein n=1 Tax=Jaapia argillacea MUCL 33604 TaxID=933084 RepID=A0A067Q4Y8_9AGAM|nr:hypothetical protein JAAARDRAFT_203257 [Jaapia argillacea MUCL 33604]
MANRKTTKIAIPHPDEDLSIVGVLEQLEPEKPTKGRKIGLILHGTMGHKDYLFQKRLAHRLPIDSFRFDFRGNHETGGVWKQGALHEDLVDLEVVVKYLMEQYGYEVDLLVGHSRGSIVGFRWLCTSELGKNVTGYVNCSGRYRMKRMYDILPYYQPSFDAKGYYEWKVTVARKPIVGKVYPKDIEEFANWDTSLVWDKFPSDTHVLTVHGMSDERVPPYDAIIYARALGTRKSGTHNLSMIEDADHNFTNRQDEVVDAIIDWWGTVQRGEVVTGIFQTGVRGKL